MKKFEGNEKDQKCREGKSFVLLGLTSISWLMNRFSLQITSFCALSSVAKGRNRKLVMKNLSSSMKVFFHSLKYLKIVGIYRLSHSIELISQKPSV